MNERPLWICLVALAVGTWLMLGFPRPAFSEPVTNSAPAATSPPVTTTTPPKHQLTGAELYSMQCNRCHPERYPTERTAAQWKTIMLHMQVRANIPGEQARRILKYLQENSGR